MERAQRAENDEQHEAAQPEAPIEFPDKTKFKSGSAPAVEVAQAQTQGQTASEQAFARGDEEVKAAAGTQKVLQYIRSQAKLKAAEPKSIGKDSMIYQRLAGHYLKDYLANPSPEAGKAAVGKVGEQMDPANANPNDYWEANSSYWNSHAVPQSVKLLLPNAPDQMGAATMALSRKNREAMPYIDAPQMIGNPNTDTGKDADVYGGGKNVSQLMHWATGVRHSEQDPETMRDLFLAYEMYHLEGWNAFGEDSINDMISEEAGRIMGRQLQAGEINQDNLGGKLDEGFDESRAWVGSLIKARQKELDAVITSKTVVESQMWYGEIPENVQWWGNSTIYMDLLSGMSVEEVQADARTQHFIEIYSLIYYSDLWQKQHQKIKHSYFTESMLAGKYDKVFEKAVKGKELTKREKMDAFMDAKAPWVPAFARRLLQKIPAVDKKLGGGAEEEVDASSEQMNDEGQREP
jgi:hypothetical protein